MSYKRAWELVMVMNNSFKEPLVTTIVGGPHGGGATITPFGLEVLGKYQEVLNRSELGLRYSKFDASDFKSILPAPTATTSFTSEADAWTAGAKWIFNPNARLLLNYIHTEFEDDIRINGKLDDTEEAVVLRAQYDF